MEALLAQCSQAIAGYGGIYVRVLIAGFVGSLTHCSTMCGPIVAAQIAVVRGGDANTQRTLLWYHAGRLTTYMLLGAVVAGSSRLVFGNQFFPLISSMLLMVAGTLFMVSALRPKAMHICQCSQKTLNLPQLPPFAVFYIRGMLLGFMPCGLVLSALLLIATTQNIFTGGLAMLLFGLTTVPVLQLIGYGTYRTGLRWKPAMSMIGRGAMTLNGLVIVSLGINAI